MPATGATARRSSLVTPVGPAPGERAAGLGCERRSGTLAGSGRDRLRCDDMDATVIEVLTALFLLVSAVGVLILIGKVERLTARIDSLIEAGSSG